MIPEEMYPHPTAVEYLSGAHLLSTPIRQCGLVSTPEPGTMSSLKLEN